jgi:hypothetical protein
MPQVSHIDVEVRPSQGYQTVGFTARLVFAEPVSLEEAKFEADLAYAELEDIAIRKINFLKGKHTEGELARPMSNGSSSNGATDHSQWKIAHKPKGAGTFDYIPTSTFSSERFVQEARAQLHTLNLPEDEVLVFDDRGGPKGIEAGNEYYCAGKIKVRSDSKIAAAMGDKSIVGNVDFNRDGTLKVSLSKDGKAAVAGLQIASQFATMDAVPF